MSVATSKDIYQLMLNDEEQSYKEVITGMENSIRVAKQNIAEIEVERALVNTLTEEECDKKLGYNKSEKKRYIRKRNKRVKV